MSITCTRPIGVQGWIIFRISFYEIYWDYEQCFELSCHVLGAKSAFGRIASACLWLDMTLTYGNVLLAVLKEVAGGHGRHWYRSWILFAGTDPYFPHLPVGPALSALTNCRAVLVHLPKCGLIFLCRLPPPDMLYKISSFLITWSLGQPNPFWGLKQNIVWGPLVAAGPLAAA